MYTKYKYSFRDLVLWTRLETFVFFFLAAIPTVLFEVCGLRWLQVPWTPIALVGTAVAFLIGFQNNAAYERTWEARKIWGGIINQSRSWAMMIRDMVTNEYANEPASEEELARHRTVLIHRHIAWLTTLRHAMRARKPWELFVDKHTNKEWYEKICIPERDTELADDLRSTLTEDDRQRVLRKTNKSAAILTLQSEHLRSLKERGLIWEFSFLELESLVKELFDLQGKSERIKNFPYPRQYSTLAHYLVRVFVILLPLGVIPEFAKMGEVLRDDFPLISHYFVWMAVPFSVIVSWVFHTMQRIGIVGENPFEGSANDVPISTISRAIEIDLREMNEEPSADIPPQLPSNLGVQM